VGSGELSTGSVPPAGADGAVMVVAVWFDDGALRVRMTGADELGGVSRPIGVAGSVDDACDVVRRWLDGIAHAGEG
jgi:hypothetical protein